MRRLSNMAKEELLNYINNGEHCNQEIIDLYDDLVQRDIEIEELKDSIRLHRSNYDSSYWDEQERENEEN